MQRFFLFLTLMPLSLVIACGSDASDATRASLNGCSASNAVVFANITVQDYSFIPACVKVLAGSSLTFVNTGAVAHTVSSDAGAPNKFDNTAFGPGATITQPFTNAGATGVHCDYHSQMSLTVIVQ